MPVVIPKNNNESTIPAKLAALAVGVKVPAVGEK